MLNQGLPSDGGPLLTNLSLQCAILTGQPEQVVAHNQKFKKAVVGEQNYEGRNTGNDSKTTIQRMDRMFGARTRGVT